MSGWREEYLAGIRDAETRNPANQELVDTCSQLADRVSALEAEKAALLLQLQQYQKSSDNPPPSSPRSQSNETNSQSLAVAKLRLQLTSALRSQTTSQSRLSSLEDEHARLKHKHALESKTLHNLTKEHKQLQTKLRDRDEELRAKKKLVADVQDELAVLNLQLNVTERRRKEQEEENKQLIERFMRRVGQEADAMNLTNEPLFGTGGGGAGGAGPSSSRRGERRR